MTVKELDRYRTTGFERWPQIESNHLIATNRYKNSRER